MAVLLLSSCASRKGIAYLQDMELGQRYLYDARYEATVHRNDRLSITVNCKRPELAIPFNAHGNSIHVGADGNVSTSSGEVSAESAKGYRAELQNLISYIHFIDIIVVTVKPCRSGFIGRILDDDRGLTKIDERRLCIPQP
jgi:polysaccharide biosynthesis/export protein